MAFIESNPDLQGQVELVSSQRQGEIYEVTLLFNDQPVPVYTTLDGQFLISDVVPLDPQAGLIDSGAPVDNAPVERVDIGADDDPFIGDENAPVTIVEFSDYECPYCGRFWSDTLPLLKQEYIETGKVKLVYRDYPLDFHPMAMPSALAANCVFDQGGDAAYFEYHDVLFANQATLSEANLIKWASDLGYDITQCLDSQEFIEEVQNDFLEGGSIGTPTFFVNGIPIEGAQPFSVFKQVIDAELAEIGY